MAHKDTHARTAGGYNGAEGTDDVPNVVYGHCRCGCGQKTSLAPQTYTSKGIRKGEPMPYVHGHNRRCHRLDAYEVREAGHSTPCWLWTGVVNSFNGYGYYSSGSRGVSLHRAHKAVYEARIGPVPDGLELDHLCRNKTCVNPEHLEPVTHTENIRRRCNTKLSVEKARQIKALLAEGSQQESLAARFGVSRTVISNISTGRLWQDA